MDNAKIKKLLKSVQDGNMPVKDAMEKLKHLPYEDLGIARVDHHRELRHGIPEVVFAAGKSRKDIKLIADSMMKHSGKLLITKADYDIYKDTEKVCKKYKKKVTFYERSGVIAVGGARKLEGLVAILCAGTSDLPIAEEAVATATFLGSRVESVSDVGVAGLHRLMNAKSIIAEAGVLIVTAGKEGGDPLLIGGIEGKQLNVVASHLW
ncbi:1-(5-phosphoribosyl)-5-amino-4-imidazole-carboxylate carboxylase [bacterium]|nr:1-(5-phosphoribosyl)-5-amino-4-imidazole-carboxylate carboxylase [bacterium]